MDCKQVNGMLDLLMDGALDEAQRKAMEAHGRQCPECAAAIRATLQMKALFDQMASEADVPLEAQAKWRGAVREEAKRKRQTRLRRWVASAAAAAVMLVGVGMAFRLRGAPKESTPITYEESAAESAAVPIVESTAEPALASNGPVANLRSKAAPAAVVEADGVDAEAFAIEDAAMEMAASEEAYEADVAASDQRSPALELDLRVEEIGVACDRIRDLAQEYEAVADVQGAGDAAANVYVELSADNAVDFLNAIASLDADGKTVELPGLNGSGHVLVLLVLHG